MVPCRYDLRKHSNSISDKISFFLTPYFLLLLIFTFLVETFLVFFLILGIFLRH
ncbi:hypothetical protein LEP1GSC041_0545 [Leptospira noguchii str. 2006001870]|nr:hypothetical protein LEP1GSC041_0545 [Leptospira noguchii str. 2006001870]